MRHLTIISFHIDPFYHASSGHPVFEHPSFLIPSLPAPFVFAENRSSITQLVASCPNASRTKRFYIFIIIVASCNFYDPLIRSNLAQLLFAGAAKLKELRGSGDSLTPPLRPFCLLARPHPFGCYTSGINFMRTCQGRCHTSDPDKPVSLEPPLERSPSNA